MKRTEYREGPGALWIVTFGLGAVLSFCYSTAHAQDISQAAKVKALSVTVPADAIKPESFVRTTPMKTERTERYRSASLRGNVTLTSIEYKEPRSAQQRLASFLNEFIEGYGSVEHLVGVEGGKGMDITTKVPHDKAGTRYTFVETRIFADANKVYYVTVETEASDVVPTEGLKTKALTEIFSSMKVQ